MVVAQVAAQSPFRRQLFVESQTVEQGTRELGVEAHEVRTHTHEVICDFVAVAHAEVHRGLRAAVEHDVDVGLWVDVHQANLMANTVV